jgi:hypothetical protein
MSSSYQIIFLHVLVDELDHLLLGHLVQVLQPAHHQTLEVQYQNQLRVLYLLALLYSQVPLVAVSKSVEAVGLLVKE